MNDATDIPWARWQRRAAIGGALGLAVWLVGTMVWHGAGFRAWWFAWVFWTGVGLGSLELCFLQFLTRGSWSLAVQRPLEAGTMTLPVMALLFLPVLLDTHDVFPWTDPGVLADAPHKRAYFTVPWFTVRTLLCFAVLTPLAFRMRFWSTREDESSITTDPAAHLRALGAGGLVAYALCMIIASTDWVMSLEPTWYSTMFVVILGITQLLTALAGAIAFITLLPDRAGYAALFDTKRLRDLGNLLMAFVIFWTYVSFSQFLIIWAGNLPREISWYLHRSSPGWRAVVIALALLQFAIPFALLLSRQLKRHRRKLTVVALLVFFMNVVNVAWMILPSFPATDLSLLLLCATAFVGMGGVWAYVFLGAFKNRPLLPRIAQESIEVEKEVVHA
jgi:hypothetical protein